MKNFLFLIALVAIAFTSCKKDDDDNKSASEYLTTGSWKLVSITTKVTGVPEATEPADACVADNTLTFKTTGKAAFDEGATKCDPSDPQSGEDAYTLSADGKTITLDGESYTVVELNATSFKYNTTIDFFGIQTSVTTNFTH